MVSKKIITEYFYIQAVFEILSMIVKDINIWIAVNNTVKEEKTL